MEESCVDLFQTTRPHLPGRAEDFRHDSLCLCRNFKFETLILDAVVTSAVSSKAHPSTEQTYLSFDL